MLTQKDRDILYTWLREIRRWGLTLPTDYFVIDVENVGNIYDKNPLLLEIGCSCVCNTVLKYSTAAILDWFKYDKINHDELRKSLVQTRENLLAKDKNCLFRFDEQFVRKYGHEPLAVLEIFYNFLNELNSKNKKLVMHNGFKHDIPILEDNIYNYLGYKFHINRDLLIDTGLIEKAWQFNVLPAKGESLSSFYAYISEIFLPKIYWSLPRTCVKRYDLIKKHALDTTQAHSAEYDTFVNHLLLEEYRQILESR